MTNSLVIAASKDVFYAWQFTDPIKLMSADVSLQASKKELKEWSVTSVFSQIISRFVSCLLSRLVHIDNPMRDSRPAASSAAIESVMVTFDSWSKADKESSDPICAIAASEAVLLVARSSGVIHCYALPKMVFHNKLQTDIRAYGLYINCKSTLDLNLVLFLELIIEKWLFQEVLCTGYIWSAHYVGYG